jgi:TonB family protein
LEKKDKRMAAEYRLYFPAEVAQQYQLPPSLLGQQQADFEAAQPIMPMSADLKPEILYRERAKYTEEARNQKVSGTIVLVVVFSKQGKAIVYSVIRGLPNGLTETAIESAQKIRFNPAMKDGQPVSVKGTVEFSFSLY